MVTLVIVFLHSSDAEFVSDDVDESCNVTHMKSLLIYVKMSTRGV